MSEKIIYGLVFSCCLLFNTIVNAQEDEGVIMPPVVMDTVYEVTEQMHGSNEILLVDSISSVKTRKLNETDLNRIRQDEDYWYANEKLPEKEKPSATAPGKSWVDIIFWILVGGGFIALLIWFLTSSNIFLFRKRSATIPLESETIEENIYELDFEKEIHKAVKAGNYRMAVRMLYLQLLRNLSEREIIRYSTDKTNSQYLSQLSGTSYYNEFFTLTRHFDYIWYGEFPLTQDGYVLLEKDFRQFNSRLS